MQSAVLLVLMLLGISSSGRAVPMEAQRVELGSTWNGQNFPNPDIDYQRCHQSKPSSICNPDDILGERDASSLQDLIDKLQNTSPCLCGDDCAEEAHKKGLIVGIAIIKKVYHSSDITKDQTILNLPEAIMKQWNMGACGNEIIIVVATEDSRVSYARGAAASELISDETMGKIFDDCKPYFDQGEHYVGLQSIINSLYDTAQKRLMAPGFNKGHDSEEGNVGLIVGLVIGAACLVGVVAAALLVIKRRKQNNQNGFMYDGTSNRPGSRSIPRDAITPIVKQTVVFPGAVYQPCSVEDTKKPVPTSGEVASDEEDDEVLNSEDFYLRTLEENPDYESADTIRAASRGLNRPEEASEYKTIGQAVPIHTTKSTRNDSATADEQQNDLSV